MLGLFRTTIDAEQLHFKNRVHGAIRALSISKACDQQRNAASLISPTGNSIAKKNEAKEKIRSRSRILHG